MSSKRVEKVIEEEQPAETEAAVQDDAPERLVCVLQFNPIVSYGKKISVIQMRKPGGQDLLAVGNPVIFYPHAEPVRIEFDFPKLLAMVARLSDPPIPSPSLAELDPRDINNLGWELAPFFTPARSKQT